MKVKSIQEVEIRTNTPSVTDSNKKGILNPGFELEVFEIIEGQAISGNNIWYKDKNGDFLWSGGFEKYNTDSKTFDSKEMIDYNAQLIGLSDEVKKTQGNQAVIAILDTGVYTQHSSLVGKVDQYSFISSSDITDKDGHGTSCASIISSISNENFNLSGIANQAQIISCKIAENRTDFESQTVLKALEFLKNQGNIDVVNMSFQIASTQTEVEISKTISEFPKTTVFVAACRNNDKLFKSYLSFPASNNEIIAVGQIAKQTLIEYVSKGEAFNKDIDFLMEFMSYLTAGIEDADNIDSQIGSSFSSSLISGLCALIISYFKQNKIAYDREKIKTEIQKISQKINAESFNNNFKILMP
ncbi:MAG: S8/S53 family peptidase [Bacteroidales bacterium]